MSEAIEHQAAFQQIVDETSAALDRIQKDILDTRRKIEEVKWDELSDKDKVKLILERVYGYRIVESEQYVDKNRGKLPADFHWPIAWWDELHEAWGTRDRGDNWNTFFDPLNDMNVAWQIMDHFRPGRVDLSHIEQESHESFMRRAKFVDQLDCRMSIRWWACTQKELCEAICKAALKASGIDI
jgi:hypothetical protein